MTRKNKTTFFFLSLFLLSTAPACITLEENRVSGEPLVHIRSSSGYEYIVRQAEEPQSMFRSPQYSNLRYLQGGEESVSAPPAQDLPALPNLRRTRIKLRRNRYLAIQEAQGAFY